MLIVRLANVNVGIRRFGFLIKSYFKDYVSEGNVEIYVDVKLKEILRFLPKYLIRTRRLSNVVEMYVSEKICQELTKKKIFLMHAAVVEVNGEGFMFVGPSGFGKTTRAKHLLELHNGCSRIINGDKPLCTFVDGSLVAYGTPWRGKENIGCQSSCKVKEIIIVEKELQSDESSQEQKKRILKRLNDAVLRLQHNESVLDIMDFIDEIMKQVKISTYCRTV